MKSSELRKKKTVDLVKLLTEKKEVLRVMSFGMQGAAKTGTNRKQLKRSIARIHTIAKEVQVNEDSK